jgi:Tol biopolymer transport system component
VFRAWDSRLERDVALKLLPISALPDAGAHDDLLAEARLLARVRHPNVVIVHGADHIGAFVGIWMELVRGRTLDDEVRQSGPLLVADVAAIATDLCGALQAVHEAGLIHGDIKAQNVVREEGGRIVLMDFGAGQLRSGVSPVGAGTPLYAAPELFTGAPASPQSDLYSLGVLVYYLLRGEHPVRGASLSEIQAAHAAAGTPPPVPAPQAVAALTGRLLAREPSQRPRSAADAGLEFARAARPAGRRWIVGSAIVAVAIVAGLLGRTLGRQAPGPSPRPGPLTTTRERVPTPKYLMLGRPSLDGLRFSYSELLGHPAFIDLRTMEAHRILLANRHESMESSVLSPDGALLAYSWYRGDEDVQELRTVVTDGGDPRVLVPGGRARFVVPVQWSRDKGQILALLHRETGARDMVLIDARDGSERLLRRFEDSEPLRPSLSPDSRFVVFDHPAPPPGGNRDVFILDVRSGDERALVSHPASDLYGEWTPDGNAVLFISDRTGSTDAWLQRVVDGRPMSEPRAVAANLGRSVYPMGLTRNGTYYYGLRAGALDVFTAVWRAGGSVGPASRLPSRLEGATAQPAWSPDGRYLAYIGQRGPAAAGFGAYALVVRDLITGDERQLANDLNFFLTAPKWRPDGSEILLNATDARGRTSYYRVNVTTGSVVPTVSGAGRAYAWADDGSAVLNVSREGSLSRFDLTSGRTGIVLTADDGGVTSIDKFGESPLGGVIAYSGIARGSGRAPGTGWPSVRLWDGGRVVEVARGLPGERMIFQCWTPDGRAVLFTRFSSEGTGRPHALWIAPVDGGPARATGFEIDGDTWANGVVMHPRGEQIAFTGGGIYGELWRMTRFLP